MKAHVYVTLKRTVLDAQGQTVADALRRMEYRGVADVRQGKYFVLTLDDKLEQNVAQTEVERIAREVLTNPVIEEYTAVRKHHTLLEICRTPEIAAEVTITAAERLGVDAAIIFADLLLPFTPMGLDFEFVAGEGPVVHTPVRTLEQVQALRTDRTDELNYVARAIEKVATDFAGPWAEGDTMGLH